MGFDSRQGLKNCVLFFHVPSFDQLRKHLAESLVLSKIDYNDIVLDPLPIYLVKRATSFVTGHYATTADAVKIGWLPVQERREWHLLKTTYKVLHDTSWPLYVRL